MANHLDVPRGEADEILLSKKSAPHAEWRASAISLRETWELVVGVMTEGGLYKKALTVELWCQRTQKPDRASYKFSLFLSDLGRPRRVYQLDTTSAPICDEGKHDWPHEHIGQYRAVFGSSYHADFAAAIAHFCKTTNISFEEPIESPFDFKLK